MFIGIDASILDNYAHTDEQIRSAHDNRNRPESSSSSNQSISSFSNIESNDFYIRNVQSVVRKDIEEGNFQIINHEKCIADLECAIATIKSMDLQQDLTKQVDQIYSIEVRLENGDKKPVMHVLDDVNQLLEYEEPIGVYSGYSKSCIKAIFAYALAHELENKAKEQIKEKNPEKLDDVLLESNGQNTSRDC